MTALRTPDDRPTRRLPVQRHAPRVGEDEIEETAVQRSAAGGPLDARSLLGLQRAAGNAAVGRLVVQRKMHGRYTRQWSDAVEMGALTEAEVERLRKFVTEDDPKDAVLKVVSLTNWATKRAKTKPRKRKIQALLWRHLARHNFDVAGAGLLREKLELEDTEALTSSVSEAKAAHAIRELPKVVYRDPPLTERDGRDLLGQITAGAPDPLAGLEGAVSSYGDLLEDDYEHPIQHEWGLGQAAGGECFVIVGDKTGVNWGAYLEAGLTPIAHAHPYFTGRRSTDTKVIGGTGRLPMSALATTLNNNSGGEILKTFPSASDISFCARKGFDTHTVFTPYVFVTAPVPALANPVGDLATRPRVTFEIVGAATTDAEGVFTGRLVMKAGPVEVWRQDVTADTTIGGSGMGVLRW